MEQKMIIDQREIQSKGGIYSKYPASYVVSLLLQKYKLERILDVTYGRGRFYKIYRPKLLVGSDIKAWEWEVDPDIFIKKPVWSVKVVLEKANLNSFDVVVVDPPFPRGKNEREEYNTLLGTPDIIIEYATKLAKYLNIDKLLVHFNKVLDLPIIENIEFHYIARTLNIYFDKQNNISYFTLYSIK